jgi:hypothetical protein
MGCFRAAPMPNALETIRAAANEAQRGPEALYAAAVARWREQRRDEAIKLMDEALRLFARQKSNLGRRESAYWQAPH